MLLASFQTALREITGARQGYSTAPRSEQRGVAPARPTCRVPGAVLILTLVALVPMAALILFVFNLGGQVNRRVAAQHTADSAAVAGAGWVTRSLNTVAQR